VRAEVRRGGAPRPPVLFGSYVGRVLDDLAAEHADLDVVVAPLDDATWERPTPAAGWTIVDCVAHLRHFDGRAALAATDPDRFVAELGEEGRLVAATHRRAHDGGGAQLLEDWRADRAALIDAFRALPDDARVPWYGPAMGARSFITARLMETWAHGQDVRDALGLPPLRSDRLAHVAFIGWRARPFSYRNRGLVVPEGDVRVELTDPDVVLGASSTDVVRGSTLDFALVVTQRRHRDDTSLVIEGPLAEEWMAIAQAFAGPPTDGRAPLP
jgi:uncharacterized protein (TIGR03084 family)